MFETSELSVHYGGVRALSDVSINVQAGELVGLIGANGAGKTTFIDAVTGFAPATGHVVVDGRTVSDLPAHMRFRAGLSRTWQGGDLFEDLSVRDNVRVAVEGVKPWHIFSDLLPFRSRKSDPRVDHALEQLRLMHVADRMPSELPQGERKLVGVARALATQPHMLCLDEPAAGLSSSEGRLLGTAFQAVASSGVGLLLVEHDVDLVLGICQRVYVLERGQLLAEGTPAEIRGNQA
ncbi:MAG: putative transporter, ATP-binding/permease protein, partial [Acidimicrobiaceae bacterium]|nr:putative transporter, ATP-binding/permease protein [Acidimicrobiaceae bacterium]